MTKGVDVMENKTKKCNKCEVEYTRSSKHFYRDKSKKDGYRTICKICSKEYAEKNKEKRKLYQKEYNEKYYEANRQKVLSNSTNYYKNNQDKVLSYQKKYYETNIEKIKGRQREYILNNKEIVRKRKKKEYQKNKDKYRAARLRRKARVRMLEHNFTHSDRTKILNDFNDSCCLTGKGGDIHMDHVLPLSKGGGTVVGNIIPLAGELNLSKNDRNLFEWFENNKERLNLNRNKFNNLIEYLAKQNNLSTEEYVDFYNKKYEEGLKDE